MPSSSVAEIARECVASRNTVESYLGIPEDLLVAARIPVFRRRARRALVAHPKFYFFDCDVFRSLEVTWERRLAWRATGP